MHLLFSFSGLPHSKLPAWMARKLYSSCNSSSKAAFCLAWQNSSVFLSQSTGNNFTETKRRKTEIRSGVEEKTTETSHNPGDVKLGCQEDTDGRMPVHTDTCSHWQDPRASPHRIRTLIAGALFSCKQCHWFLGDLTSLDTCSAPVKWEPWDFLKGVYIAVIPALRRIRG